MLKITGIAKTEVIFVYSLISGNAPNLQVTLQSQKIKKKRAQFLFWRCRAVQFYRSSTIFFPK